MAENIKNNIFKASCELFKKYFFWSPKEDKDNLGKTSYIKFFLLCLFTISMPLFPLMHLIKALKDSPSMSISEDMGLLSSSFGCYLAIIIFFFQRKKLNELFKLLMDFEKFPIPENFENEIDFLNLFTRYFTYYRTLGLLLYGGLKLMNQSSCIKERVLENEICGLITSGYFPFYNLNALTFRIPLLIWQYFGIHNLLNCGVLPSTSSYEISSVLVLHLNHLRNLLENSFNDKNLQKENIKICIKYHNYIMKMYKLFDEYYKRSIGVHFLITALVFGSLTSQFKEKQNSLGALVHLAGWLIALSIICHGGQKLINNSLAVGDAVYCSKWYEGDVKIQKNLIMIIKLSQRPFELHAIALGIFSYGSLVQILKTSYSYLTLLQQKS